MGIIRTKPVDQDRDRPTTHNRDNTNDDSMSALITSNIFDHDETKEEKAEDGKVIRRERSHRSFRRTVGLPAGVIDRDGIVAKVEDGVLRLTIPKAPESVPKTITVE